MTKIIPWLLVLLCSTFVLAQSEKKDLTLTDLSGRTFKVSDYKGRVVLVNFWATWCPPCLTEIPELVKMQREYRKEGLQVIGITYPPEKFAEVRQFTARSKVNYPIVLGNESTKASYSSSDVLPLTVVVDRTGEVREVIEGILLPEEFEEKIKPLLSRSAPRAQPRSTSKTEKKATIRITSRGYSPSSIRLRKGITTELVFIRTTDLTCGTELRIPVFGISRSLPLNEKVIVNLTPLKSGTVKITCGMAMFKGSLIIR